ncbi:MAG TPA: hypothetical protein VGP96_09605 [Candidatus Dormibacteraeota bacterium]|jgi:hypothetical protein|nr:hypothetical protein [Candidatus Dormibacteraeota bacterium]
MKGCNLLSTGSPASNPVPFTVIMVVAGPEVGVMDTPASRGHEATAASLPGGGGGAVEVGAKPEDGGAPGVGETRLLAPCGARQIS